MKLYKQETGNINKPNIVLLHAWGCDHRHMQPIVDILAGRYHLLSFDLPGRGKSDWSDDISSIHDFADKLLPELPERAIYIGWSFGGLIVQSLASRYPEKVMQVIGIGTTPKFVEAPNWVGIPQPGFIKPFKEALDQMSYTAFMEKFIDSEFQGISPLPVAHQQLYDILHDSPEVNLDILYRGINIVDAADLREDLKQLQCQTDFIWGGNDDCVPEAAYSKILKLNPLVKKHIIPGAHHMMFWTHPKEFGQILNSLL